MATIVTRLGKGTPLTTAEVDANFTNLNTAKAELLSPTFTGTVTIPSGASIAGYALLASPTFTGTPASTTPALNDNTTRIATTSWFMGQAGTSSPTMSGAASAGTSTLWSRQDHRHPVDTTRAPLASPTFTGTVTIPAGASISGYALLASPTFTGTPLAPTAALDTNTTQLATTAWFINQGSSVAPLINGTATVGVSQRWSRQDHVHPTDTTRAPLASPTFTGTVTIPAGASIAGYALLASPTFTGTPSAPTALADTSTTQLATTAFVIGQAASVAPIVNGAAAVGVSFRYARQDHVHPTDTTRAPLASPTFTGTPVAPTAALDAGTTQIANTIWYMNQGASSTPLMDGAATVGVSGRWARQDHIHPTDFTRAPLNAPSFTGGISVSGTMLSTGKLGYLPGSGGQVTQVVSKSNPVTLNALNGQITMHSENIPAGGVVTFTLNNNLLEASDLMVINVVASTLGTYVINCNVSGLSCAITVKNVSNVGAAEPLQLRYTVIRGVIS
jgi:hypothetical protein